jgi:hypothetical protein
LNTVDEGQVMKAMVIRATLLLMGGVHLGGCRRVNPAFHLGTTDGAADRGPATAPDARPDRDVFDAANESPPAPPAPDAGLDVAESRDLSPPDLPRDLAPLDLDPPEVAPDLGAPPPVITLGPSTLAGLHGTKMGNTISDDRCPAGQALIGYRGTSGLLQNMGTPVVTSLAAQCGILAVDSTSPAAVTVAPGATFAARGMRTGQTITAVCPANQVVVTFDGRAGSFLDQLRIGCARLTIESGSGGTLAVKIGVVTRLSPLGGTGGEAFEDGCPAGQIATGHRLEALNVVDSLALACALPSAAQ